jgi:4Fe-4S ferredoxin
MSESWFGNVSNENCGPTGACSGWFNDATDARRQTSISGVIHLASSEECKHEAGTYRPVIDRNRCEGKAECVRVCPVSVYSVGTLPKEQRVGLSFRGKIKGLAHRWQQAMLLNAAACEACGLCVEACPENAITLTRV